MNTQYIENFKESIKEKMRNFPSKPNKLFIAFLEDYNHRLQWEPENSGIGRQPIDI